MMCVKDTFPPRVRLRWLLITILLSISSFAGMARTLVAVGTVRERSMLTASALGIPLRMVTVSCSSDSAAAKSLAIMGASAGIGADCAGRDVVVATGCDEVSTDDAEVGDSEATAEVERVAGVEKPDF